MSKPKLTKDQKAALAAYEFALRQEDRYLGSVFVNPLGQRTIEAKTKALAGACGRRPPATFPDHTKEAP